MSSPARVLPGGATTEEDLALLNELAGGDPACASVRSTPHLDQAFERFRQRQRTPREADASADAAKSSSGGKGGGRCRQPTRSGPRSASSSASASDNLGTRSATNANIRGSRSASDSNSDSISASGSRRRARNASDGPAHGRKGRRDNFEVLRQQVRVQGLETELALLRARQCRTTKRDRDRDRRSPVPEDVAHGKLHGRENSRPGAAAEQSGGNPWAVVAPNVQMGAAAHQQRAGTDIGAAVNTTAAGATASTPTSTPTPACTAAANASNSSAAIVVCARSSVSAAAATSARPTAGYGSGAGAAMRACEHERDELRSTLLQLRAAHAKTMAEQTAIMSAERATHCATVAQMRATLAAAPASRPDDVEQLKTLAANLSEERKRRSCADEVVAQLRQDAEMQGSAHSDELEVMRNRVAQLGAEASTHAAELRTKQAAVEDHVATVRELKLRLAETAVARERLERAVVLAQEHVKDLSANNSSVIRDTKQQGVEMRSKLLDETAARSESEGEVKHLRSELDRIQREHRDALSTLKQDNHELLAKERSVVALAVTERCSHVSRELDARDVALKDAAAALDRRESAMRDERAAEALQLDQLVQLRESVRESASRELQLRRELGDRAKREADAKQLAKDLEKFARELHLVSLSCRPSPARCYLRHFHPSKNCRDIHRIISDEGITLHAVCFRAEKKHLIAVTHSLTHTSTLTHTHNTLIYKHAQIPTFLACAPSRYTLLGPFR